MNDRLRDLGGRLFGGRPAPQSGTDEQDEAAAPGRRVAMARLAGVGAVALAAGSLAPLGAQEPDPDPSMGGVVDARGFGAVGDGEADDTVPLSAVMDWARPQILPVTVVPGGGHFFHGQLPLLKSLVVRHLRSLP